MALAPSIFGDQTNSHNIDWQIADKRSRKTY